MRRRHILLAGALAVGVVGALTMLGVRRRAVEQRREPDREALAKLDWTGMVRGALANVLRSVAKATAGSRVELR